MCQADNSVSYRHQQNPSELCDILPSFWAQLLVDAGVHYDALHSLWIGKSGKTGIVFLDSGFGNPAKSGSSQISSRIWQMPVQLQYVQLITNNTGLLIWNKKVWAIKYWQYFYCIGTGMAHTFTREY